MDVVRVRAELACFVEMTASVEHALPDEVVGYLTPYYGPEPPEEELLYAQHGVEAILGRLLLTWRSYIDGEDANWQQRRAVAVRAIVEFDRRTEINAMLGDDSPTLSAGRLHPWAWEGAQSAARPDCPAGSTRDYATARRNGGLDVPPRSSASGC